MISLGEIPIGKVGLLCLFCQRPPCGEPGPVLHVCLFVGTPGVVFGLKCVLRSDDLPFEKSRQGGMILGKSCFTTAMLDSIHGQFCDTKYKKENLPCMRR